MPDKKLKKSWGPTLLIACVFLFVFAAWGVCFCFAFPDGRGGSLGTFGDSFGAVGSLFSALAFGGVIWSIVLQRQELQAQREEMREQREEFELQTQNLRRQRFETSFFKQLEVLDIAIRKLGNSKIGEGSDVLFKYWGAFTISLPPVSNGTLDISYSKKAISPMLFNFSIIRYENLFLQLLDEIAKTPLLETDEERKHFQKILWNLRDENELRYLILRAYEMRNDNKKRFQVFWNSGLLEDWDLIRFFQYRLQEHECLTASHLLKQELDKSYR